jgi:hypothetical protein
MRSRVLLSIKQNCSARELSRLYYAKSRMPIISTLFFQALAALLYLLLSVGASYSSLGIEGLTLYVH